jgi:hypothetical protein
MPLRERRGRAFHLAMPARVEEPEQVEQRCLRRRRARQAGRRVGIGLTSVVISH